MAPKKKQVAAPNATAVFEKEPHVCWPLSHRPCILARNHDSLVRSVKSVARVKTTRENNGIPRFLNHQPMVVHHELHYLQRGADCRYVHSITVLPRHGFLVLIMRPPAQWGWYEKGPDGQLILDKRRKLRSVEVLFRLSDMYVQGFQHENLWRVFQDVKLKGLLSGVNINRYVRKLPFDSSYGPGGMNVDFSKLKISDSSMFDTYKVLSNNSFYSDVETRIALATISVTVSEATKSRFLQRRVFRVFSTKRSEVVDNDPEDRESKRIHSWGKRCTEATEELLLHELDLNAAEQKRQERANLLKDLGIVKWFEDK